MRCSACRLSADKSNPPKTVGTYNREVDCNGEEFRLFKWIVGLSAVAGIAYLSYKVGENSGQVNERFREKYGDDEDDIDLDDDEDEFRFYDNMDEPDDECLAPMNGEFSHDEQYPDHHGTHPPIGYDENCENGDCFYVRLIAIDLDDIPTETASRVLVATKHSSYITNKAIRAATGCSYDTAERILRATPHIS